MPTLRQIQMVRTLADHRHFTRAASALGVTQSALTKGLQALEDELSVRLFDRGAGALEPTMFGAIVLALTRREYVPRWIGFVASVLDVTWVSVALLLYAVVGKGTRWLSEQPPGTAVRIYGPLGNGFTFPDTPANRKKLEKVLSRIESEIEAGTFKYEVYFPNSKALKRLPSPVPAEAVQPVPVAIQPAPAAAAVVRDPAARRRRDADPARPAAPPSGAGNIRSTPGCAARDSGRSPAVSP